MAAEWLQISEHLLADELADQNAASSLYTRKMLTSMVRLRRGVTLFQSGDGTFQDLPDTLCRAFGNHRRVEVEIESRHVLAEDLHLLA
jgi:ABC-type uncharacterized transport system ATPase subunit